MLAKSPPNRAIRHEIAWLKAGRWIIDSLIDGEEEAIARARELLKEAADGIEAARVVRQRPTPSKIEIETEVFREEVAPPGKPAPALSATDDNDCWCETLDDLYGGRSRRAIGQLLRGFLDQLGITPLELLHNHRFAKKLESTGSLQAGAVHRIAKARAEATGAALRDCTHRLDELLGEASERARDALAVRAVPKPGESGLDGLVAECRRLAPDPAERLFWLRHAACRQLEGCSGLGGRLELALEWSSTASDPDAVALVDAIAADCLGNAALVQEMLGPRNDLGAALRALAAIAHGGVPPAPARAPGWFPALAALLAAQPCPEIRASFLARLYRELREDKPLVPRGGAADEAKALTAIGDALRDEASGTFFGGGALVRALAKRWRRLDVNGGFGDLPAPSGDPAERLRALLEFSGTVFGDARKRALATLILDAVPAVPEAARAGLAPEIAGAALPPAAREAVARALGAA